MTGLAHYQLPTEPVRLNGPVERPAPGTLPLRGDLAHVALAGKYLAAHYVIPTMRTVGAEGAALHLTQQDDAEVLADLAPGAGIEALDYTGDWCWACCGPQGPTGYVRTALLAPDQPEQ